MAFLDNYDIRIAQHVKALSMIESTGIIRQILVENKINEILAMQIQHYLDYGDKERFVDLTKMKLLRRCVFQNLSKMNRYIHIV